MNTHQAKVTEAKTVWGDSGHTTVTLDAAGFGGVALVHIPWGKQPLAITLTIAEARALGELLLDQTASTATFEAKP